jgi:hypothetical protein
VPEVFRKPAFSLQHAAGLIDKFFRNRLQDYFRPVMSYRNPRPRLDSECGTHLGRDDKLPFCAYRCDLSIHAYIIAQCKNTPALKIPLDRLIV